MGGTGGFCVALVAAPPSGSGALLHDLVILARACDLSIVWGPLALFSVRSMGVQLRQCVRCGKPVNALANPGGP